MVVTCDTCIKVDCWQYYPDGIPDHCIAWKYGDVLEHASKEYNNPEIAPLYITGAKIADQGKTLWPRIKEAVEFAKELGILKVGIASCAGLIIELREISMLFRGAGFEVSSCICQVGRVPPEKRGVSEDYKGLRILYAIPIAQAEILNYEHTELNFQMGLCLGMDMIFNRYSQAPVSTLIVKDRVTGNNPSAALFSFPHRRRLSEEYCGEKWV